ncbi:transcriptional regulator, TetR family [Geobacter metallireducens RCH3]|uniref:Transcriptional regulator, TetR family n=1 Tax=Geobacter metallireducens (strain ATCC 53774 / DSM 7210 / GS-15) TaxID=269799 RepID=Q39VH0_GEOMG|nr:MULTISPECIES: TetR/AcrR family transcriptional regulator [Geobacter]ABB31754.1 transcriptional regulator, TetR family [Geobacter metallireducens GS-15]EHP89368.1 transcriptional regulator, TetR family [Geobacter metallireducens RCH3]MBT1075794.1 TetR/AcrR family transcriptional regulator [Geobacter grbiciae]
MRISEQAKQENRGRILEKAAKLFCGKGFEATTTRDIALAAGLATGTMFNYFPSKETLAMTMVAEALSRGGDDYEQRRSGNEELAEELFLFIASGLRRLRPLRPFLGPVLERSLSPFPRKTVCPEGEAARQDHLAAVHRIIGRHGFTTAPDYVAITIYWSLYLGVLAFWASDESPNQEASRALIDYSIRMFVQVISGSGPDGGGAHEA